MMLVQLKGPPTDRSSQSCLAVGSPMGQRGRDIWSGVLRCKNFWTLWVILGKICRRPATVDRKGSTISDLTVIGADIAAAAERIAGLVERTPLIESEIGGGHVWLKCECLQTG